MFRLKKYNFLEFSLLIYRIVPLWAVFLTAITMISSVFPSIAVVLTGKFLDAAMEMIDNEGGSSVAWFTIAIFAIFVLLQNVFNFFSAFMIQKASLILTEKIKHKMIFLRLRCNMSILKIKKMHCCCRKSQRNSSGKSMILLSA